MKACFEVPMVHMEDYEDEQDYLFAFAHLYLLHPKYREYCLDWRMRHPDQYLILDNGAWEGHLVAGAELIQIAKDLQANEVVAPDVVDDPEATLKHLGEFVPMAHSEGLKVQVALQGLQYKAYENMVLKAFDLQVDSFGMTIGPIYKVDKFDLFTGNWATDSEWTRLRLVQKLSSTFEELRGRFHLLGCNNPWCLQSYGDEINTLDTSIAVTLARQFVSIHSKGSMIFPKPVGPNLAFEGKISNSIREMVRENMRGIKKLIGG